MIDISPKMITQATKDNNHNSNFECKNGSIYDIPYDDNYFDTVLVMGVMEYLECVKEGLKDIKRVTKKGGTILLSYPNKSSPMRKMSKLIYTLFNRQNPFASKMFTANEVKLMARELNLSIIDIKGYNAQIIPFPLTWKIGKIAYYLVIILEPLLNYFGTMWGTSFIVKLKK